MILPDVNLLLYAYDEASPFHARSKAWCERIMSGADSVVLLPAVTFGYMRISTHPRVFVRPLTVAEAATHVRTWLSRANVKLHEMLAEDVETALQLLESAGTAGNLTTDAQIAAVALRLDAEVHSSDADFARFPKLKYSNPLA